MDTFRSASRRGEALCFTKRERFVSTKRPGTLASTPRWASRRGETPGFRNSERFASTKRPGTLASTPGQAPRRGETLGFRNANGMRTETARFASTKRPITGGPNDFHCFCIMFGGYRDFCLRKPIGFCKLSGGNLRKPLVFISFLADPLRGMGWLLIIKYFQGRRN